MIETQRLVIRPFVASDLDAYAPLVADPEVMRYIADGKTQMREDAQAYIQRQIKGFQEKGYARFAVCLKEDGRLIGFCGLVDLPEGDIDFGWRFFPSEWGKGYGKESAAALLAYALEQGLKGIVATAYHENVGSVRIMESIGMVYDGDGTYNGLPMVRYVAP